MHRVLPGRHQAAELDALHPPQGGHDETRLVPHGDRAGGHAVLRFSVQGRLHPQGGRVDLVPCDLQGRLGDLGLGPGRHPSFREAAALVVLRRAEAGSHLPHLLVLQQSPHQLRPGVVVFFAGGPGQQHGDLDAHQRRGHLQELPGFVELGLHESFDGGQKVARDAGDGNVEDVDVLGADQVQEQVQRSVEAIGLHDQQALAGGRGRHSRCGAAHPTAIRMIQSNVRSTGAKKTAKASRKRTPIRTRTPIPNRPADW